MLAVADAVMMSPRANHMTAVMMVAAVVAPITTLVVTTAITTPVVTLVVPALVGIATAVVVVGLSDGGRAAEQSQGHRPGEQFGHWKSPSAASRCACADPLTELA